MRLQGGGDSWEALNTNEEAARLEAKKLAMHMLSIDDDFSNIEGRLQTAREDMSSESTDASQIDGLLAEWVEYKKRFKKLTWDSRALATEAAAAADDYANDFMEHLRTSLTISQEEIITLINDYIKSLDEGRTRAQTLVDSFNDLRKNIVDFQEKWMSLIKDAIQQIRESLNLLNHQIEELKDKISMCKEKITNLGIPLLGEDPPQVAKIFFEVFPNTLTTWLWDQLDEPDRNGLRQILDQMDDHQITSNELMDQHLTKSSVAERLCFMLSKSKNDFDGMTEKLGCVGSIWGVIQSELGAIRGHMNLMVHQQSKTLWKALFPRRSKKASDLYLVLAKVLRLYAEAVNDQAELLR